MCIRDRIEMAQVGLGDAVSDRTRTTRAGADRPIRRAPTDHQDSRVAVGIVDFDVGNRRRDRVYPGLAGADHEVVVGRIVGDVAGAVGLLQAADAVLESSDAGGSPRAGPVSYTHLTLPT